MKTALEVYCTAVGWDGGTIHQAFQHFSSLNKKERDRVCGILSDSSHEISDLITVKEFMRKRNDMLGIQWNSIGSKGGR